MDDNTAIVIVTAIIFAGSIAFTWVDRRRK